MNTTISKHFFYRYPNLVTVSRHNMPKLWVAHITYIAVEERIAYIYLITDAYSRKIVGFPVSDNMSVDSVVIALQKEWDQKPSAAIVIHHSDRGIRYCSNVYVQLLQIKKNKEEMKKAT